MVPGDSHPHKNFKNTRIHTQEISQLSEWEWKKDTVDTKSWEGSNSTPFRHEIEEYGE